MKGFDRYQIYRTCCGALVGKLCLENALILPFNSTGLTKSHRLGLVLDWN